MNQLITPSLRTVSIVQAASKGRYGVGFAALCLGALCVTGCDDSASAGSGKIGAAQGASSDAPTKVEFGTLDPSDGCGPVARAYSPDGEAITLTFSNGDPENRLMAQARKSAPTCTLSIPMKVPAGYKFSPTNIVARGFGHHGYLNTAYWWVGGDVPEKQANFAVSGIGYTFERQLPANEPDNSTGIGFELQEPLAHLWSPTCDSTQSATLVVTVQPFLDENDSDSILALDSMDITGFGGLESCSGTTNPGNKQAEEGKQCGYVNSAQVDCIDTSRLVCLIPFKNDVAPVNNTSGDDVYSDQTQHDEAGTCIDFTKPPTSRVAGSDGGCGGPFHLYCPSTDAQQLVCQFKSKESRQATDHLGQCVPRLELNAVCDSEKFGDCDGNNCNPVDPCKQGLKCQDNHCVDAASN